MFDKRVGYVKNLKNHWIGEGKTYIKRNFPLVCRIQRSAFLSFLKKQTMPGANCKSLLKIKHVLQKPLQTFKVFIRRHAHSTFHHKQDSMREKCRIVLKCRQIFGSGVPLYRQAVLLCLSPEGASATSFLKKTESICSITLPIWMLNFF